MGETVRVQLDGETFTLVANGRTPSGRSVAWVEGGTDATRMFVEALEGAFGGKLSQAIAKELDLHPAQGVALQSSKIDQALTMAETASEVLAGVEFAESLKSPTGGGETATGASSAKPDETSGAS